jgi:hypothetical protein
MGTIFTSNTLKNRLLFYSLFGFVPLFAQGPELIQTINIPVDFIQTDNLGNIYVVKDFRITQFDRNGRQLFVFEDYSAGKISHLDVTDPMKIIVYYKDFMVVRLLDKTLSELSSFRLNNIGFDMVEVIAHTRDRRFWIYNQSDFKLKKIDDSGNVINESELFNILFREAVSPAKIIEFEGVVYLNDPKNGVYVFDQFGTFIRKIPVKGIDQYQLMQDKLLYFDGTNLSSYDLRRLDETMMELPEIEGLKGAAIQKARLYMHTRNQVFIYRL